METIKTNYLGLVLVLLGIIILASPAFPQDTIVKSKSAGTKVRIIEKNEDGIYFDTTFNEKFNEAMERVEEIMKDNNIRMKDLDRHMRRVQVYMDHADSSMKGDSVITMAYKMVVGDNDGRMKRRGHREMDFDFDFQLPEPPEAPEMPDLPELRMYDGEFPFHQSRSMRGHEQTLSDVLGEIPMSNVKSYKVKERGDGKRIIIDLDDDAIFDRQEKVIILREHGRKGRPERPDRPSRPPRR